MISIKGETHGFQSGSSGPVISKIMMINIGVCGLETLIVKNKTVLYVFREVMIDREAPPDFIEPWEVIDPWLVF